MIHNTRSSEQLEILRKHIDFQGKSVIDLGCGYGDILRGIIKSGASFAVGVDKDVTILNSTAHRSIVHIGADIETVKLKDHYDIAICFSVLPYLKDHMRFLEKMSHMAEVCLVECQYTGDGPGLVRDDDEMRVMLEVFWPTVLPIGKTKVDYRDMYRTIWMCL